MKFHHIGMIVVATLGVVAAGVPANAGIIYQDSFSRTGNLNGSAPDVVDIGGATWIAATVASPDTTDGTQANNLAGHAAFLPFTPLTGKVYTLSADLDTSATDGVWEALGFTAGNTTATPSGFHIANTPGPWLLQTGDGTSADSTFMGPNTANQHDGTASGNTGYMNYAIVLDTTGALWTATFYRNGSVLTGPFTYAVNPTINYVAIGNGNIAGNVDNFILSVPEPGSLGLMSVVGMIAAAGRRRRGA